jgi:hypothetical protein
MAVDILRLRAKYEALRAEKSAVEGLWDEIERYILPTTSRQGEPTGEARSKLETSVEAWDLTAPLACEHLASSLHGSVTSPAAKWLDFEWQDADLERDHEAIKHREALSQLVWNELQASDFNMEIASGYLEYAGLGNMVLTVEPTHPTRWEGLDFTAVPCREANFEEDSRGGVKTLFRRLRWTPVQILDKFGEEGTPERIRKLAEHAEAGVTRLEVVFCIFRREEVSIEAPESPVLAENRAFGSVYFTLEQTEQLGDEGGYYEMPAVVARWARVPGSKWGFGRGNIALRNVKYLNAFKESARAAAEKAVDPSLKATENGVLSDPDLSPSGVTIVSSMDELQPLESGARFDISAEVIRDEQVQIRRAFHEDDLQLKESPAMTATEVQARRDLMDRVLGSPVGRLQADALVPIVMIVLRHLYRAKRLPVAPASVKERKAELKVRFRGPIARAQVMDEVVGIEREAAFVASLLKMGFQEARFHFDVGQAIREHAKRVGSPASTLHSMAKAKELEAQARAAAERQAGAEASKVEGEAMRAMTQAASASGGMGGGSLSIAQQPALVPSGGMSASGGGMSGMEGM